MPGQVTPQELSNFFTIVVQVLERLQIPYMVAGGFAAIFYGGQLNLDLIRKAAAHRNLLKQFEQLYEAARREIEE